MKNICIITGGMNLEYDVSIRSAYSFISYADHDLFKIYSVVFRNYNEFVLLDDFQKKCSLDYIEGEIFLRIQDEFVKIDNVLPIMQGQGFESGHLQGYLETIGIPYIGNNLISSAVSFDKVFSKFVAKNLSIVDVVPFIDYFFNPCSYSEASSFLNSNILFIKPADNGSSFGCYKVSNKDEFDHAIFMNQKITRYILIEKYINAFECSCAILKNKISDVLMIEHSSQFFDYHTKYGDNNYSIKSTNLELTEKIQEISMKLFKGMRLSFMARFDFFVEYETQYIYFNEAKSLPGMTSFSLFFKLFQNQYSPKELIHFILS